jgi:hypothetical protein
MQLPIQTPSIVTQSHDNISCTIYNLLILKNLLEASLFIMKVMSKISKLCNVKTSLQVLIKSLDY